MASGEFQGGGTLRRADPRTIQDKVLFGYQGWFTCAGDGEPIGPGHHGWLHWFNTPIPCGGRPNTDLWPDTSEYDPSELYPAPGLTTSSGDPVYLFSSRHPRTVRRHFHWMARHGVDGAFLQRFASQCEFKVGNHGIRDLRDEIGERVREAAEAEGRVFAIMYDVSGVSPDRIQNILEGDWMHLIHEQRVLDSPNYLHEKGRPVVALWGFGFNGRNHTPALVRAITEFFRSSTPGGVYLVAGAPGHWRTSSSDADRNPGFVQVWTECFDAISPWTVGRYGNEEEAERWGEERVKADADYLKKLEEEGGRKIDYIPVVLPGGSGFNLSGGKWGMNDIRRNGGRFLWRQIYNARRAGVRTIYGAMWDEYDEGTAFMPVVSYSSQVPVHPAFRFIALDIDGHDLPSDWYMRIAGFAAEAFHGERTLPDTLPYKELQAYWNTRPRRVGMGDEDWKKQVDVDEVVRAFSEWEVSRTSVGVPSDAPPPYSLEDVAAEQGPRAQRPTPPAVAKDTRPSSSHRVHAAAIPLAAATVAHKLSTGSTGATPRPAPSSPPPVVNLSSRPSRSTTPRHPSKEFAMATPPPLPQRPVSPPHLPPRSGSFTQTAYDLGGPQGVGAYPAHRPAYAGHVSSPGYAPRPIPSSEAGMAFPSTMGHFPVGHAHPHGRGRSRSRGGSRSRSRSRSRSGSRSSSGSRKWKRRHGGRVHRAQSHGRSRSRSHSRGRMAHAHAHSHGHGHPHPHGHGHGHPHHMSSVESTHSAGAWTGPYAPPPTSPVGYGHGHGGHVGHYDPPHSAPPGPMYAHGYQPPQAGFAPPQGYGYSPSSSGPYYGYGPAPGMNAPYAGVYAPGTAGGSGGSAGRGGMSGSIASVLQTVEGMTSRQTRMQLEKKVSTLMNKLK